MTSRAINSDRLKPDLFVVGTSAGGVYALRELLALLPADLPAAIAIVQHHHPTANVKLAPVIGRNSRLPVMEGQEGMLLEPGHAYLAPRDHHLIVRADGIHVSHGAKEHFTSPRCRPALS